MADLSQEEKDRIYQEEKARRDAQAQLRHEEKRARQDKRLRRWGPIFVGLLVLFIWGMMNSNPTAPPSRQQATGPCDVTAATEIVDKAESARIISSIEGLKIFVTNRWEAMPIQAKSQLDNAIQCILMNGGSGRMTGVSYRDARNGKEVATSDYKLHMK